MAFRGGISRTNPPQGSGIQPRPMPAAPAGGPPPRQAPRPTPPNPNTRDSSRDNSESDHSPHNTMREDSNEGLSSSGRMTRPIPRGEGNTGNNSLDNHFLDRSNSSHSLDGDDKEDVLIKELCSKIGKMVCEVSNTRETDKISQEEVAKLDLLKVEESALLELSKTKLDVVAAGLVECMTDANVSKEFPNNIPEEERNYKTNEAKIYLYDLLANCMEYSWAEIKKRVCPPPVEAIEAPSAVEQDPAEADRKKQEVEKRKVDHLTETEKIFPPHLPDAVAMKILEITTGILLKPAPPNSTQHEKKVRACGRLIYNISARPTENPVMNAIISGITNPDEVNSPLNLIEFININQKALGKLLEAIGSKMDNDKNSVFKKLGHQLLLARVLSKGIWNFINHYPMEFVSLCQLTTKLDGNPDKLFDIFAGWAGKNKKVKEFWEIQTMLLILCPDVMLKVALGKEKLPKEMEAKDAFLQQLNKAMDKGKMADVAAHCYVNICKASTNVAKTKENGLRFLVPKIEPILQEKLFPPDNYKMSPSEYDPQQVQVMTDCLVAMFRMSARKILMSLCPKFLSKDYPPVFKMVLINTFQTIRDEGEKPFVFAIKEIYGLMSGPLRVLFQSLVEDDLKKLEEYRRSGERKTKALLETTLYDIEILKKLIYLFYTEPELPLVSGGQSPLADLNASKELMTGLCYCASYFALPDLAQNATNALMELHRTPELISKWVSGSQADKLNGFWDISCAINVQLANVLIIRPNLTIKEIRQFVHLIKEILARRNGFLAKLTNPAPQGQTSKLRTQTSNELETALLVHICNSEPDIVSTCAACIGYLCEEIDLVGEEAEDSASGIHTNYEVYRNISRTGVTSIGRAAKQRGIRLLLRRTIETYGNVRAWESVYKRWSELTAKIVKEEDERIEKEIKAKGKPGPGGKAAGTAAQNSIPLDVTTTWNHFSGFLCAMSGVAIGQELAVEKAPAGGKGGPPSKAPVVKASMVDKFIEEMLQLIVSKSDFIKETSTELIGSTLSPAAYSILFKQLCNVVGSNFGKAGQVQISNEGNQLVNQTISIVKHILELPQDSYTHSDLSHLQQFEHLMNYLLTYTSSCQDPEEPMFPIRMKMKMCGLIEAMMQKTKYMVFSNEFNFRKKVLEMVMEWISDFSLEKQTSGGASAPPSLPSSGDRHPLPPVPAGGRGRPSTIGSRPGPATGAAAAAPNPDGNATIRRLPAANRGDVNPDLDVAVLKSMSALLKDLPFIKRGSEDEEEADLGGSSTLGRYFQFFTDLLTRTKADPSAKKEKAENAVVCLSNLLSANIDSALDYFVTMGYHEDLETRAAFLEVLSTILISGTEFDAGEREKYDKLVDLLLEPSLDVVLALCEVIQITEADELASILVRLFESNDKTLHLLRKVIEQEVGSTETPNTLFRRNSMATKLLAAYTKILGKKYLKDTLGPIIQGMIADPPAMELDPAKIPANQTRDQNLRNVSTNSQIFLDAIARSAEISPVQFRVICNILKETVGKRFPGAEAAAIGGFIYLRYICPAIVAPDGFGVVQTVTLSPDVRRGLIVATKVIQNAANQVLFTKEPHMEALNDFIKQNIETMNHTFSKFATYSPQEVEALRKSPKIEISEGQRNEDMAILHYHLATNLEKIRKSMTSVENAKKNTNATAALEFYIKLTTILSQLGTVPDPSQIKKERAANEQISTTSANRANDALFQKTTEGDLLFEKQYVDRKILYKQGTTKDKKPVFYFIARKFDLHTFTPQTSQYFITWCILKVFAEFKDPNKKFVLVIDASLFKLKFNDVQGHDMYPNFGKYAPQSMIDNMEKVYVIYPNADFKKYVKKNKKYIDHALYNKVQFFSSAKELFAVINENDCGLPSSTLAIENNAKQSFSVQTGSQKQVLKISNNLLSVTSEKPTKMVPFKQEVCLMEVFHIAKIRYDNRQGEELILTYDGEKLDPMRCEDLPRIMKELKSATQRYNLTKKNDNISGQKRSTSVPGTLLNMALLNLGNTNNVLREESYRLLSSLCSHFRLAVHGELRDISGLCVPKNSAHLALGISRKLSEMEQQYTLDFLEEALHGLTRPSTNMQAKQFTLDYITYWLPNLQLYCTLSDDPDSQSKVEKVEKIIALLLDFTIKESGMTGPILSKVWEVMGSVHQVIPVVIEVLLSRTSQLNSGLGTHPESVILDIFASLASPNPRLVSGNLIHRLLKLLRDSDGTKTVIYEDEKIWKQVVILLRILLGLSFDNLIYVQNYLAELMYIVLMLFGMGSPLVRATVHGLLINTVHSVYTQIGSSTSSGHESNSEDRNKTNSNASNNTNHSSTLAFNDSSALTGGNVANKLNGLKLILSELNQQKTRVLYGLSGFAHISPHAPPTTKEVPLAPVNITTTENVATQILSILSALYTGPGTSSFGTPHHSRLLYLITKTAWTANVSLRPRAVISLGVLCNSPTLVTDTLLGKVLLSFREVISTTGQKLEHDLPLSLIICITRLFEHVSSKSKFFRQMFWVAMILLEMDEVKLFAAAINLLEMVIRTLDTADCFEDGLAPYCMSAREQGGLDTFLSKADNITGINFRTSFSFAVAAHLLKGLRRPETKTSTTRVLSLLVDISAKSGVGTSMLGYLAALLPVKGEDMEHLKQLLGAEGFMYQYLFTEQMLPDTMNAALLFTTLVTLLKSSDAEVEQLFIYQSLREGVLTMPEAFPVVYQDLIPKMKAAIKNSQNQEIIDACLSIMKSIFNCNDKSGGNGNNSRGGGGGRKLDKDYLKNQWRFQGLVEAGSFQKSQNTTDQLVIVTVGVLDTLLKGAGMG
eukprot:TRINITY_DN1152_c0_g1_i1.p1 TRINITY_DN1152_c0_g1~~TRINITY_DN1152_c0_g1_i1.p1  ORF type:complete len:2790 (-),score=689.70 TRINITY_DN1152_c0_g1_i1:4-8373(-)